MSALDHAARLAAVRDALPRLQLLRERLDTAEATGRGVEEARLAYDACLVRVTGEEVTT